MARTSVESQNRIVTDPEIMTGKPVVRGTRIPVEKVLDQLAFQPDLNELFEIYPELTIEDVKACLAYARSVVVSRRRAKSPRTQGAERASA